MDIIVDIGIVVYLDVEISVMLFSFANCLQGFENYLVLITFEGLINHHKLPKKF